MEESAKPGPEHDPEATIQLADCYRAGAEMLLAPGAGGLVRPPGRLNAIHAIELYLNAYLLHHGTTPKDVRKLQHDIATRWRKAQEYGLALRPKTARHLEDLSENREYLHVRYPRDDALAVCELNRLTATLVQVADAVHAALARPGIAAA